jgi:hypothetical protein
MALRRPTLLELTWNRVYRNTSRPMFARGRRDLGNDLAPEVERSSKKLDTVIV